VARILNVAVAGCAIVSAALTAFLGLSSIPAGAASNGATLYREAMATTKAWSVHYASGSTIKNVSILESGDAGPASGTQAVLVGQGAKADNASLIVIGDLTYMKANEGGLEDLAGLSAAQAAATMGKWVLFSTNNPSFSEVVAGIRSRDVAQEIALKGPYTLGRARKLDGFDVDSIHGTQKVSGHKTQVILYVRARGRHLLVEEDTVDSKGTPNGVDHIIFSKWGEKVKPKAPDASFTLGAINTA
jgi:hypothetical protein